MQPQSDSPSFGNYQGMDTISTNQGFNTALQLRLDPTQLLGDVKDFLSGTTTFTDIDDNGKQVFKCVQNGEALANGKGIQAIMMKCVLHFNPHLAQGNYNDERYNLDRKFNREDWAIDICMNRQEWGINPTKMDHIVNTIINLVKKFESRTLYNKERESYATTLQTKESNTFAPQQEKKGWGF